VSRAVTGLAGTELEFEINPLIVAADGGGAFAVDLLATGANPPGPEPSARPPLRQHHER
jgi:hypothetical protein